MKILDVPQAGKCGVIVGQGGRYGQVRRALAIPTNPRTQSQMLQRNYLAAEAVAWRGLSQLQRDTWTAAAKQFNSKASVGQKGPLTGCQLFCKVNVANLTIGNAVVNTPPARPEFGILPIDALHGPSASGPWTHWDQVQVYDSCDIGAVLALEAKGWFCIRETLDTGPVVYSACSTPFFVTWLRPASGEPQSRPAGSVLAPPCPRGAKGLLPFPRCNPAVASSPPRYCHGSTTVLLRNHSGPLTAVASAHFLSKTPNGRLSPL